MSVDLVIFEEKNRREAALYTAAISAMIMFLFYYITIFTETDIVKPDYGIEVNFGTSDKGSGDIQTHNAASDLKLKHESAPPKDKVENVTPPVKPVEPKVEKVKSTPVKAETAITSKVESPVKVKDITDNKTKVTPPKVTPAKVEPVKAPPAPVKVEAPKTVVKPDAGSLYSKPGGKTGGNGTIGTSTTPGGNNNGDGAKGEVGDKGDPKGKIDAPLYSGKPGSGGNGNGGNGGSGSGLVMTGWTWSKKPVVNDDSDETGNIRFEIKVDEQGEILSVKVLSTTVSQSVVNMYKRAIEKVSFVPTNNGARQAVSTGTINIKINPRN
jgi:periplasmic protein TonB